MDGTRSPINREQVRFGLMKVADVSLDKLFRIWDRMGFDDAQRKSRCKLFVEHVNKLMDQMIDEEEHMMNQVAKNIEDFDKKLKDLCEELSLPPVKTPPTLTMVQRERILRSKVDTMTKEKSDRLNQYKELHAKDQVLCDCLANTPFYIPSGVVPSLEQLKELQKHVQQQQTEKEKRFLEFTSTKKRVIELYNTLETDPNTSFSRDIVCEDDDAFVLSLANMKMLQTLAEDLMNKDKEQKREAQDLWERLRALWNRLETTDIERQEFELKQEGHGMSVIQALKTEIEACEQLKLQNIKKFVEGIRTELSSWWDKCFYSKNQRDNFTKLKEDDFTEELLTMHEEELEKVRAYFKEHRDLLEEVHKREHLFQEMIVFEEKASDPKRFFQARGGKLLQEEKARKKLQKELPKVEEVVTEKIIKWETENNKPFLINGLRFPEYTQQQWDDFHNQKEQQKQSRKAVQILGNASRLKPPSLSSSLKRNGFMMARAKQTNDEMMFGSRNVNLTPSKRRGNNTTTQTPMRTPLTARKLNALPKTPNTTSKLSCTTRVHHSTMLNSPCSRKPLYTPKTPTGSTRKRRSVRLMKKAATERKTTTSRRKSRESFSHTTVSADHQSTCSLASTGSYHDFASGLSAPHCRSSVAPTAATTLFPSRR